VLWLRTIALVDRERRLLENAQPPRCSAIVGNASTRTLAHGPKINSESRRSETIAMVLAPLPSPDDTIFLWIAQAAHPFFDFRRELRIENYEPFLSSNDLKHPQTARKFIACSFFRRKSFGFRIRRKHRRQTDGAPLGSRRARRFRQFARRRGQ